MKQGVIQLIVFFVIISLKGVAQNTAAEDKLKPKPYCFTEVSTYQSFDENIAEKLRKEFSLRYSNINILMSKQKIQFQICSKTDLSIEDIMIRSIFDKYKVSLVGVVYSFVPFEVKNVCEYPECE